MPRKSLKRTTELKEVPSPAEPRELQLGPRTFVIAPMASRGGSRAYDDAADFTIAALPLLQRMFTMAMASTIEQAQGSSAHDVVGGMVAAISDQDIAGLIREMRDHMAYLGMLACRGTDPAITEDEVKELAGSPLSDQLAEIVFTQIAADGLFDKVISLGAGFSLAGRA